MEAYECRVCHRVVFKAVATEQMLDEKLCPHHIGMAKRRRRAWLYILLYIAFWAAAGVVVVIYAP
jgi:type VI protein secretion system component VasF